MRMPFASILEMPKNAPIFDFTQGDPGAIVQQSAYGIGRYHERRPGIYTAEQYAGIRDIHVGIDLFAPVGSEIRAFADGKIFLTGYNSLPLDYGYTLITEHDLGGVTLYALHGHLSAGSVADKPIGQPLKVGQLIAWVGDRHENGGWLPHLHFQLSYEKPQVADLPGVVSEADLALALLKYPDPRLVLGSIY